MAEDLYAKKKYESILTRTLGSSPKLRIIDFFLDNPLFDFTKKEVLEALGMGKQTFYKYFPDLERLGVVVVSRKIGRVKLYKLNLKHPLVRMLREYEREISLQLAEMEAVMETRLAPSG
ncbi:MAG: winged helix-turn-helix domain-containing protein [archaeon GB-1867-035]|nr:winged helix-turn-helix domain-containing protein [Candidatus Culexmicrobium profundum]